MDTDTISISSTDDVVAPAKKSRQDVATGTSSTAGPSSAGPSTAGPKTRRKYAKLK